MVLLVHTHALVTVAMALSFHKYNQKERENRPKNQEAKKGRNGEQSRKLREWERKENRCRCNEGTNTEAANPDWRK